MSDNKEFNELDNYTGNLINDLWCALSLYVEGCPLDEDHREKHLILIQRAKIRLGIPETLEELVEMLKEKGKSSNAGKKV